MSTLSLIYVVLFYAATLLLLVGLGMKIAQYARTPAPLKIPTTPAPTTSSGVAFRMAREVVLFESLFKSSKWTWIFGWMFHLGLFLVLVRHLRYFIADVPGWLNAVQPFGKYAAFMMVAGLVVCWRAVSWWTASVTSPPLQIICTCCC